MFVKLQICIVVLFVLGIIFVFGKRKAKEKLLVVGLVICTLISAFISNAILGLIPLPTNEVIVTALGKKNDAAKSNEVSIIAYLVDGKECAINNPTEGKWFWKGNTYMWRNESDFRQPVGTTRTITLNIPYGKDRSIEFGLSQWNGLVSITYDGKTAEYDLYKQSDETILYVPVPDTNLIFLYGIKFLRLIFFVVLLVVIISYPIFCTVKYDEATIKFFLGKHWDKIYYIILAVLYIILMQKNSIDGSLWGDEIWELGWKYAGNPYKTQFIYYYLTKFWLFIMPYGQEHLLLLPQIMVSGTIYLAGVVGNKIKGKRVGILFASLVAFSLSIVYQCAMEYRVYAFMLFSTALVFYTFTNKCLHLGEESFSDVFFHGLAVTFLMDMHPFGVAVAGLVMIADFVLIIIPNKLSNKSLLGFIFPTVYGLWWIVTYVLSLAPSHYATWMSPPNAERVIATITWLMGNSTIMFAILIFGAVTIFTQSVRKIVNGVFDLKKDYISVVVLAIPSVLFLVVYIYSTSINLKQQLFFDRYFISIVIFLLYITAIALDVLITLFAKISQNVFSQFDFFLYIILMLCIVNWSKVGPWEISPANDHTNIMNYKSMAEYLLEQNDIYADTTFFILDHNDDATLGFQYYLTHNGTRDVISYDNSLPKNINEYKTIYFSYIIERNKNKILNNRVLSDNGFQLETDEKNVKILKFVRKSNNL